MLTTEISSSTCRTADAELFRVGGEPLQDVSGRTHGVGHVKLAAGERGSHGQKFVAGHEGPLPIGPMKLRGERLELFARVVVASSCGIDIHPDDLRLLGERRLQDRLQAGELQTHEAQDRAHRDGVLHDRQVFVHGGQLGHRQRTEPDPGRRLIARVDLGAVVQREATRSQLLKMAVQGVLVQSDERVDLVAMIERLLGGDAHAQPGMPAANHRLVAVVRERRKSLAGERQNQRVPRRRDPVARPRPRSRRRSASHSSSNSYGSLTLRTIHRGSASVLLGRETGGVFRLDVDPHRLQAVVAPRHTPGTALQGLCSESLCPTRRCPVAAVVD